jgi:hypothetical protein
MQNVHYARSACKKNNAHSNQLWLLWAGTLAQPIRMGWVQPFFAVGWNINLAHAAGLSPALWLGLYSFHFFFCVCVCVYLKIVIFPRHFD